MKIGGNDPGALLQAFQNIAKDEGVVRASGSEDTSRVLAVGRSSDNREVQWVTSTGDADTDAAFDLFMQTLTANFGGTIQASIANELGLSPGKPLEAREVRLALEMAENHVGVYEGINFMTQLQFSAASGGSGFGAVAENLGINPANLSDTDRKNIDQQFAAAFNEASQGHTRSVSSDDAAALLATILREHTGA